MINKLLPELNKVYQIKRYTLLHILGGSGGIEVDFKVHHDWRDKLIFLDKGQYIKFLSDNFVVRRIEFEDENIFRNQEVRVLFKHLVSLGYINFSDCENCQKYLNGTVFSDKLSDIIDVSTTQWFWQNPFHSNKDEYHIIFDVKDMVDANFKYHLSNEKISKVINFQGYDAHALLKTKVGVSIKSLMAYKRLLESKKEIVFTDKNINEIAYEFGFKDPAYFNRVFKKNVGKSPLEFRNDFEFENRDSFLPELYHLLEKHHKEQRNLPFYANEMHLSVKSLSKKVKDKLNVTLSQLIRQELIKTAKLLLHTDIPIKEIAFQLGFEETNHFSSFFKHYANQTPTEFRQSAHL